MGQVHKVFLAVLLLNTSLVYSTIVNGGKPIFCTRANITAVRIQGCAKEPCQVKKGVKIPIEIDFRFQAPKSTDEIEFQAFAPYWNVPGTGAYGSNIAEGSTCSELKLQSCPAIAGKAYRLKSELYADPKLESTVGRGSMGEVRTGWMLTPNDRSVSGPTGYSQCSFNVKINLIN